MIQDIALGQTPREAAAFTGQAVTFAGPGEAPWTGLVAAARPGDGTLLLQFTPPTQGNRLYSVAETVRFDAGGPRSAKDALAPLQARFGEPAAVFDQTGKQVAVWRFVGGKPAAASVDVASDCSPYTAAVGSGLRPIGWPGSLRRGGVRDGGAGGGRRPDGAAGHPCRHRCGAGAAAAPRRALCASGEVGPIGRTVRGLVAGPHRCQAALRPAMIR